jgi:hypothetical protein
VPVVPPVVVEEEVVIEEDGAMFIEINDDLDE